MDIPKLAHVTLLTGKNGVGKTTVLDGVQLYAAHGHFDALHDLLMRREELTTYTDENGGLVDVPVFDSGRRNWMREGHSPASSRIGCACCSVPRHDKRADAMSAALRRIRAVNFRCLQSAPSHTP